MVPDKFDMVDMGGIDLILMQGEEVPGLYSRLVESITQCRYQCLYNWLFDGVIIPPTYVELEVNEEDEVAINEGVTVSSDDVIHIYSLEPVPVDPEIIPLLAEENGEYTVPTGVDGFNPVTVDVPSYTPVINSISIAENGTYTAPSGVDGYSPVTVNVPSDEPIINPITITENGIYNAPVGVDGYAPVTVNVSAIGGKEYLYDYALVSGHTPVNIFNGEQSETISTNSDGTIKVIGMSNNRRFVGFAIDLTTIASISCVCSFRNTNASLGMIASASVNDIMSNVRGNISVFPAYVETPPANRVCKLDLNVSSLTGVYYVGIVGYEETWSSCLGSMWINRS